MNAPLRYAIVITLLPLWAVVSLLLLFLTCSVQIVPLMLIMVISELAGDTRDKLLDTRLLIEIWFEWTTKAFPKTS